MFASLTWFPYVRNLISSSSYTLYTPPTLVQRTSPRSRILSTVPYVTPIILANIGKDTHPRDTRALISASDTSYCLEVAAFSRTEELSHIVAHLTLVLTLVYTRATVLTEHLVDGLFVLRIEGSAHQFRSDTTDRFLRDG